MSIGARILAGALALLLAACGPAPTKDERRGRAIEQSFVGRFDGSFEQRAADGSTVTRPARMRGTRLAEGGVELTIELGPVAGRRSPSAEGARVPFEAAETTTMRLRVLAASRELEYTMRDGAASERFRIERFAAFSGLGELIVNGQMQEDGAPVDVRILYSVEPGRITWTRDARPPGGEFKFRQRYTMRRAR